MTVLNIFIKEVNMANYWANYTARKMISEKHRSSSGVKKQRKSIEETVVNTLLIIGVVLAIVFGLVAVITGDVKFLAVVAAFAGFAVVAPIAAMVVSDIMCRKK